MCAHFLMAFRAIAALALAGCVFLSAAQAKNPPPAEGAKDQPAVPTLVQKVYPVADLLPGTLEPGFLTLPGLETGSLAKPTETNTPEGGKTGGPRLLDLITALVAPQSWNKQGGRGTIAWHPQELALSVMQTPAIQEQVEDMLTALRRLQQVNVAVEVRLLRLPGSFLDRLDLEEKTASKNGRSKKSSGLTPAPATTDLPAFLTSGQVREFLDACRADPHAEVLQSPRMMGGDGQVSTITMTGRTPGNAGQTKRQLLNQGPITGYRLSVQPVVSGDRRYVRLSLAMELTYQEPGPADQTREKNNIQESRPTTVTLKNIFTIPDGSTVLLGGWSRDVQVEGKASAGRESILLMVTPRIIIPEEEEAREAASAHPLKPKE